MPLRELPEALFMLFLLTAAWCILFLPIQYILRQYVLRHAVFAKLPYMILPIFMYIVLVLALLIYKKSFSSEDIILFFTDRTRLIFIHFTFFLYLLFSTLLHQFAPAAVATKQTRTDILDDL
jgi:type VI protein secretion system component VasK